MEAEGLGAPNINPFYKRKEKELCYFLSAPWIPKLQQPICHGRHPVHLIAGVENLYLDTVRFHNFHVISRYIPIPYNPFNYFSPLTHRVCLKMRAGL